MEQPVRVHKVLDQMQGERMEQPVLSENEEMHRIEYQIDRRLDIEVLSWPVSEILETSEPKISKNVWTSRLQFVFFNALSCFQPFFPEFN
jgi:hypothetical protein